MSIKVKTPDGGVAIFPDGTPTDTIESAMQAKFGKPKPSAPTSPWRGALAEATDAAMGGEGGSYADPNATSEDITNRAMNQAAVLASGAGGLVAGAGRRGAALIPGTVGRVAQAAMAHPRVAGAVSMALPSLAHGDIGGALRWGTLGAIMGMRPGTEQAVEGLASQASRVAPAAEAAIPAVARGVTSSGAVPAAVAAPRTISGMMSATVPAAEAAAPQTISAMVKGAATIPVKAANTIVREFAKAAAPKAKLGEKIWIKLNDSGLPEDVITPGQASRVPAALKTWVARTW